MLSPDFVAYEIVIAVVNKIKIIITPRSVWTAEIVFLKSYIHVSYVSRKAGVHI